MEPQSQNQTVAEPVIQPTPGAEQKKCKHVPIIIVLAILLVGSCAFGGFELWQSMQKDSEIAKLKEKESTQSTTGQDNTTDSNLDNEAISVTEAEKILAKYIGEGNSTMAFGLNAFYETFTSDFDEQQEAFLAYSSINEDEKEAVSCVEERYEHGECTGKSISYDLMSKEYQSLFGDYSSIEKKNYTFQDFFYLVYDDNINAYREFILPGGGMSPIVAAHKVASVKKDNEKMVVSLIFAELNTDVELASGICGPTSLSGGLGVTNDTVNKMIDSMSIYEFTLSPYGGSYVLTDVEKTN
ncbi:hypothetical protein J5491_02690 [Candidatus Saccharibacteria bacterium]|nr:hypothetical protein [Candidatus Saccharibacteria bacterium]